MRLNVFLAKGAGISRRKADKLIIQGKVKVNNSLMIQPFYDTKPKDKISLEDKPISLKQNYYVILNKPLGVTSTVKDWFAEKTVCECLPEKYKGVYPVGRLDQGSTGLIILTNDGDLCYRLTHPKFEIEKEYLVRVRGLVNSKDLVKAKMGVEDEGEVLKVKEAIILKKEETTTQLKVVINEGKKRHLRRLFSNLGLPVRELKRVRIGGLLLGSLKVGEFKEMPKEVIYRLTLNSKRRNSYE